MDKESIIKLLSYGMTRVQLCDYFGVDEPTYCEYVETEFNTTPEKLEKQYKANMTFNIYQQLNHWMSENPKILQYVADRFLGPVEHKAAVTIINDVNEDADTGFNGCN